MTPVLSHPLKALALLAGIVAVPAIFPGESRAGDCAISGTITATYPNDPGFEGLWKYCVNLTWDTDSQGLSHTSIFLGLEACECLCDAGIVQFPTPAGTSNGDPDPCVENYNGQYVCTGDPTIPEGMNKPAVKFEHDEIDGCEPGSSGTGVFCFYTPFPPNPPDTNPTGVGIKFGGNTCLGELSGQLPTCECPTPVENSTWSRVKSLTRF